MEQRSSLVSISILLLSLLFALCSSADGRKDSGNYWKGIMKDEPMPAALEAALTLPAPATSSQSSLLKILNRHHDLPAGSSNGRNPASATHDLEVEEIPITESFEPRPDITAYGG